MKKKVLLAAVVAMFLTVFESVPVYAGETQAKTKKTAEDEIVKVETKEFTKAFITEEKTEGVISGSAIDTKQEKKEAANSANEKTETDEKTTTNKKTEESKTTTNKNTTTSTKTTVNKKTDSSEKKAEAKKTYTNGELKLLACLIYAEAGNQSYKGKLAVANVVINRVKSGLFPNSIKEVAYQSAYSSSYGRRVYQFSVASPSVGTLKKAWDLYGNRKNSAEIKMEQECIRAAKAALEGESAFEGANYLFFCRYSNSLASRHSGIKIGAHYFYK